MMLKIILLAFVIGIAKTAVYIDYLPEKPCELAHKVGCYIKKIKDVIDYGSTITPLGECIRIHCSTSYIEYATCGAMKTDDPNCTITAPDVSKPYPDCCPNMKCNFNHNTL
ncbi:hypothetical protein PYW08_011952 [Mythimna loreyi]|uniref:Uncharacterized protein n=1 Tax=Mythimna loreyi TaxID=667449 RepID=A0ACC2QL89_9NEOP|nr:hypothetical protein PYW08_011952 [Mythimna loreyi]